MSAIQGNHKELNLVENMTANADYPTESYLSLSGDHAIAIYGTFDTATLQFVFFTEKANGDLEEMPSSADFQFTAVPELQRFSFPKDAPFKIRVSSVGASTDLSVNAHKLIK